MKKTVNYLMAAAMLAAGAFSAPDAAAGKAGDWACATNKGGGALSKMRIAYRKPTTFSYNSQGERRWRFAGKRSYTGWSRPVAHGQTSCIFLDNRYIKPDAPFFIEVQNVGLVVKSAACKGVYRTGSSREKGISKHVSFDIKATPIQAHCLSGPYYWDKCGRWSCKYDYRF